MNVSQKNIGIMSNTPKSVVVSLMNAMLADYPSQYRKNYPSKESAGVFKQRLISKLSRFKNEDIIDGYEYCIDVNPRFMPAIPELIGAVTNLDKKRRKESEAIEIENKAGLLPSPTHLVDPLKLLAGAKNNKHDDNSEEARLIRLAEKKKAHEALIIISKGITQPRHNTGHGCHFSGCDKSGGISSGLQGGGSFYCADHYGQFG